jgi:hypothetical protein
MPVTPMFITKEHFESAMIELAYRPELFDTCFDENVTCQLTTGYLAFACSCVKFSAISDDICNVHDCHFLKSQKIRDLLTIVLFVDGSPTRSNFETVATLLVEVAYTRFVMRSRELQKSLVN